MLDDVRPLSATEKFNFGVGQVAEGIKTCAFATFLMFYYNQVLGLSSDLAGAAIALALVFDAITDPIVGSVSDRWQGALGRRHPFLYASAVPLGLAFILLFVPLVSIESAGQGGLFAWMLGATILTRAAMTLYHVPHMALGAELSADYDERTVLVAIRNFFGAVGFVLVFVLGFGVFLAPSVEFPNGQLNAAAYPPYAVTLAVIMTLSILLTAFGTRGRIPDLPKAQGSAGRVKVKDVLNEAYEAMRNPSFRWMMFGFIMIIVGFGIAGATGLYMFTFFWEFNGPQILLVLMMGPVGSMVGYAFARRLFVWLDKRAAMIAGGLAWMVIHALPVTFFLVGLAPPAGTWAAAWFLGVIVIFGGAAVGVLVVGIGSAMADIADENELLTGRRQEGVFFGASAFANKCSAALGSLLAGMILQWIGWPVGRAVREAADIPQDILMSLAIWSGPVTSLLAIPGVLCLLGYRLNRSNVTKIQAQLNATNAN